MCPTRCAASVSAGVSRRALFHCESRTGNASRCKRQRSWPDTLPQTYKRQCAAGRCLWTPRCQRKLCSNSSQLCMTRQLWSAAVCCTTDPVVQSAWPNGSAHDYQCMLLARAIANTLVLSMVCLHRRAWVALRCRQAYCVTDASGCSLERVAACMVHTTGIIRLCQHVANLGMAKYRRNAPAAALSRTKAQSALRMLARTHTAWMYCCDGIISPLAVIIFRSACPCIAACVHLAGARGSATRYRIDASAPRDASGSCTRPFHI
jgi:hypothetical protein